MADEESRFKDWLEAKGLSSRTLKEYLYYYNHFGGSGYFNQEDVDEFIARFKYGAVVRAFVKNFQEFLIREFPDNTSLYKVQIIKRTGRRKKRLPVFINEQEMKLIEANLNDERKRLMLLLTFYCGLRCQGLLNVKAIDFGWKEWNEDNVKPARLRIVEKGNKERIVFVPSFVMIRVKAFLLANQSKISADEPIFNISIRTWQHSIRITSQKAIGRQISPHKIRHGTATWLQSKGWSIQEIAEYLGHESIATAQVYTHLDKEKLAEKYTEMF